MPAVNGIIKRENLFQEISGILRQWSELERRVFSQSHYHGQSLEEISRSLQLDVEEVSSILKQCNRQLCTSLRSFRIGSGTTRALIPDEIVRLVACSRDLKGVHPLSSKANIILDSSQMAI